MIDENNFNPLLNETFIFRPLNDLRRITTKLGGDQDPIPTLRYAEGNWIPDDGEYDLAFIQGNIAYYVQMPYYTNLLWSWQRPYDNSRQWHYKTIGNREWRNYLWGLHRNLHLNEKAGRSAMNKCSSLHGCTNSHGPEIIKDNEWIQKGLLKIQRTGEIIKPPKYPTCYKCIKNNLGHRRDKIQKQKEVLESTFEDCLNQIKKAQENLEFYKGYSEEVADNIRKVLDEMHNLK